MSPRQPAIGIVGSSHVVPRFWGELPVSGTPRAYVDGLVLTGGGDVDPRRYGGTAEGVMELDAERDEAEIALVQLARQRGIPLLHPPGVSQHALVRHLVTDTSR